MTKQVIFSRLTILSVIIIAVGTLFLIMHWPGARYILLVGYASLFLSYPRYILLNRSKGIINILKIIGVSLWAGFKILILLYPENKGMFKAFSTVGILLWAVLVLYQYMGFESYQSSRAERVVALVFLSGSTILAIGLFFKILHWPYAGPLLVAGLTTAAIAFIATLFVEETTEE